MIRFYATAAVVLLTDQASKWLVRSELIPGETVSVIGSWFMLRHVHNAGAAFGLFPGNRIAFIFVSLVSVAAVIYLVSSGRYNIRGSRVAFGMVLGGAIGNLIDRLWLGYVVDFLDVGIGAYRWPTFNVADIGVTLGVLFLAAGFIAMEWANRHDHGENANPSESEAESSSGSGSESESECQGDRSP